VSIDALLAALRGEAEAQARQALADAEQEAARLRAASAARIAARRNAAVQARRRALRADDAGALAAATHEARAAVLTARERLVERVLAEARRLLPAALDAPEAGPVVERLVVEALAYVPHGEAVVRCSPGLLERARAAAAGRSAVRVAADPDLPAGVLVRAADGSVAVDNTLGARLERLRPALAIEIVRGVEAAP
jgi:vacuolar-type H+-ATPase subunit E/Vma4